MVACVWGKGGWGVGGGVEALGGGEDGEEVAVYGCPLSRGREGVCVRHIAIRPSLLFPSLVVFVTSGGSFVSYAASAGLAPAAAAAAALVGAALLADAPPLPWPPTP